jgi:hypothetical protein
MFLVPFFKYEVRDHDKIKNTLLDSINKNTNSLKDNNQSIYNSDWNQNLNVDYSLLNIHVDNLCWIINSNYYKREILNKENATVWFQQYAKNDFHDWHVHSNALYSAVYFLDVDDNTPTTTFRVKDDIIEHEVKEGEIIVFPSSILHCSKPNKSEKLKTVIAFNLN